MRRFIVGLVFVLTAPAIYLAIDLPRPPEGFKWREVGAIKGAFLVPHGWHFRAEESKGTLAFFITEDDFTPPEMYRVGVSINVFLGDPAAPSQIEEHLRAQAEESQVEVTPGKFGPFLTLQCQYDLAKTAEHAAIRVVQMGIVNPGTQATYLVVFESPVDEWDRAWVKGKVIVMTLALNDKI